MKIATSLLRDRMEPKPGEFDKIAGRNATAPPNHEPPKCSKRKDAPTDIITERQVQAADYIAVMCGELATMANGAGLGLTAHLLAMAKAEAERITDRAA